jgi:hypothetical protein
LARITSVTHQPGSFRLQSSEKLIVGPLILTCHAVQQDFAALAGYILAIGIFGRFLPLEVSNNPTGRIIATDNPLIVVVRGRSSTMTTILLPWWALAPVAITVVAYLVYQATIPTPLPGIPYKTTSASRLLGDLPNLLNYTAKTRQTVSFFASHCVELNSPITQIFIRPFFSKPWVIITDSRE